MERAWYAFSGKDPFDVKYYHRLAYYEGHLLCGEFVCAISAPDNGAHPADPLSENLQKYIRDGLSREVFQPEKPLHTKIYVYMRG